MSVIALRALAILHVLLVCILGTAPEVGGVIDYTKFENIGDSSDDECRQSSSIARRQRALVPKHTRFSSSSRTEVEPAVSFRTVVASETQPINYRRFDDIVDSDDEPTAEVFPDYSGALDERAKKLENPEIAVKYPINTRGNLQRGTSTIWHTGTHCRHGEAGRQLVA